MKPKTLYSDSKREEIKPKTIYSKSKRQGVKAEPACSEPKCEEIKLEPTCSKPNHEEINLEPTCSKPKAQRTDKISFPQGPTSFIDQISFNDPPNSGIIEYSTLKVGLDVLSKYFNLPDDSKTLISNKTERDSMLKEANKIVSKLIVSDSNISVDESSHLGNEYSYFSPHKVKKMSTKDLMRFVALTNALNNVPEVGAPIFGAPLGRKLANNINSWLEEIMKEVKGLKSDVDLFRLTVIEKSGRLAKRLYDKGGNAMRREEVTWVITGITYVLERVFVETFTF